MARIEDAHYDPRYCYICARIHLNSCEAFKAVEEKQLSTVGMFDKMDAQNKVTSPNLSVLEREIWNKAIEAAELELHNKLSYPTEACAIIRGLKMAAW